MMKKAKYLIWGILVLILILLILAIFIPKEYVFQIDRTIQAPKSVVYNLLSNLENRKQWDPIAHQPEIIFSDDNNIDIFQWSIKSSIVGKLKIQNKEKNSSVSIERFMGTTDIPDIIQYTLDDTTLKATTKTTIDFKGRSSWPMNLFNMFLKRKLTKKIKAELVQLELIAKERQVDQIYNGYKIVEGIVKERNFILRRDEVSSEAIQQFYVQNLGVLFKKAQDAEIQMDGMPSGLFYTRDMNSKTMDMAAAIPVIDEVNIQGAESEHMNTRTAIVVDYYGNYNQTIRAHSAIKAYITDHGYMVDVPIIEEYVTDPGNEKDPNKWLTKITYYIEGR